MFNLYSGHGSPCIKAHVTVRKTVCRKEVTGRFVTGLWIESSGFHPTVAQMGFLLGQIALGQAFLRVLQFPRDKYYSSEPPYPSAISLWHNWSMWIHSTEVPIAHYYNWEK